MKKVKVFLLGISLMILGVSFFSSNTEAVRGTYICGNCPSKFYDTQSAYKHASNKRHNVYLDNGSIMWCNLPIAF